jgi:hypothetical protein
MIMAPCDFVVTPASFNALYSLSARHPNERVTFGQQDKTRHKVRRWMADNAENFPL